MGGRSHLAAAGPRGAAVLVLLLGRLALCLAVEGKKGRGAQGARARGSRCFFAGCVPGDQGAGAACRGLPWGEAEGKSRLLISLRKVTNQNKNPTPKTEKQGENQTCSSDHAVLTS